MFNTSGLQERPTSVRLYLHTMTSDQLAVINVTIDQEVFVWRQPALSSEDNENEVKISLGSSLILTTSTLTVDVTSSVPIKLDQHFGLVLYMGGIPEDIDDLLTTPLDKSTQAIHDKKERFKINVEKKDVTGKPCQLESFKLNFSELGGNFESIILPLSVDIGLCVGECTNSNTSLRSQVFHTLANRNLEGSGNGEDLISSLPETCCTVASFMKLPVLTNDAANGIITHQFIDKLVAETCGCS